MGSGVISLEVKLLVLEADKSLHLLPGLGISGDVTPLPYMPSWLVWGKRYVIAVHLGSITY